MDFETPVIVSRTDRLGDLVLSLPVLGHLRNAGVKNIWLRVAEYAQDVAWLAKENGLCEKVLVEGREYESWENSQVPVTRGLFLVHKNSQRPVCKKLKMQMSVGPRTHLSALWSYTYSIPQHRSRIEKSEMEYNIDLANVFLEKCGLGILPLFQGLPALRIPSDWKSGVEPPENVLVVTSRGSAKNLPLGFYLELARERLAQNERVDFLASGLDAIGICAKLKQVFDEDINKMRVKVLGDFPTIKALLVYLSRAKKVFSPSTGPLHMAHAMGVPVMGYYPKDSAQTRTQVFKRWRPHGYWHDSPLEFTEF